MSKKTTSERQRTAAGDECTSSAAETPPQNREARPEPPRRTMSRGFIGRVTAIFAGERTAPQDMFRPLQSGADIEGEELGRVENPMAHEFFSLAKNLEEQAAHLPHPKNPEGIEQWKRDRVTLAMQSKIAMDLFWQCVRVEFPDHDDLAVSSDWFILEKESAVSPVTAGPSIISGIRASGIFGEILARRSAEGA